MFSYWGGTAQLSAGTIYIEQGWVEGLDVCNTTATVGLVLGVVLVPLTSILRTGAARNMSEPNQLTSAEKIGYIAPPDRRAIGLVLLTPMSLIVGIYILLGRPRYGCWPSCELD